MRHVIGHCNDCAGYVRGYCPYENCRAPEDKSMTDGARKDDAGKAPVLKGFLQCFPRAMRAVATVSQAGFEKYGAWSGWRGVPDGLNRYGDADVRHLLGEATEGVYDLVDDQGQPGTRCLHMALHAWNALARLEQWIVENPDTPLRLPPEQEPVPVKEPEGRVLGSVPTGTLGKDVAERLAVHNWVPQPARSEPTLRYTEPRPLNSKFDHACPDLDQEYPPCSCSLGHCLAEVLGREEVYEVVRGHYQPQRVQCVRLRAKRDDRFDVV